MKRRTFISRSTKASMAAAVLPGFTGLTGSVISGQTGNKDAGGHPRRMIGIQIGAVSFYDEGVKQVLDNVQELAGVNTLFVPVFAYNRGLAGRQIPGEPFPDHGVQQEDSDFVGGYYANMHEEYYRNTVYKPEFARAPELGDYDVLAEVIPEAKRRNMKIIAFFADNFGRDRPHYEKLTEVDIDGNPTGKVNLVSPDYRGLLFGLVEDCIRSYEVDGVLWRTERTGPISDVLGFTHTGNVGKAVSFDRYTLERARKRGINPVRAKEGFSKLESFAEGCRNGKEPVDGRYVTFWRICLEYPEILSWEMLWIDALRDTYKEVYHLVKSVRPEVEVGSALSFKGIYNPFYRARQDLQELGRYSDFLKIVMYYNVGGVRMHTFIDASGRTLYGDMGPQRRLNFVNSIMGYEDMDYEKLESNGLPVKMIERETRRAMEGAEGTPTKIWPAIDIDIPARRFGMEDPDYSVCTPESTRDATLAVFRGGAEGVILARKYSEMNLSNLKGVRMALDELEKIDQ